MVVDRMAGARERTDQVLAFYSPGPHHTERVGETSETSLDYRTRLPRVEARVGTGTLRTSNVGAGEVFTITPRYASPLTASSSRNEAVFPPPQAPVDWTYAPRNFRLSSTPAARRVRVERHNPHSIATLRIQIARHLTEQLTSCPFCVRRPGRTSHSQISASLPHP